MRKRLLPVVIAVLAALSSVIYGLPCSIDSGQTVAFTLTSGAKASWNHSTTVLSRQVLLPKGNSFFVHQPSNGGIVFSIAGSPLAGDARISLFTINGRHIATTALPGRASGVFRLDLPPGIYLARCDDGTMAQTIRFIVGR